jgi:hypothetical protein
MGKLKHATKTPQPQLSDWGCNAVHHTDSPRGKRRDDERKGGGRDKSRKKRRSPGGG